MPGVVGALGEVVELLDPVVPVVPPLPTVPDELPPTPVLPVPAPAPVLPALPEPMLPPVLEAPMSCRHLSFADWSVSFSQVSRAEALSVEPEVTPEDEPEAPELDGVEDEPLELDGVEDEPALDLSVPDGELELDGRDGEVVLLEPDVPVLPDPLVVWATATLVAARNAAATAACRIFIVIASLLIN